MSMNIHNSLFWVWMVLQDPAVWFSFYEGLSSWIMSQNKSLISFFVRVLYHNLGKAINTGDWTEKWGYCGKLDHVVLRPLELFYGWSAKEFGILGLKKP